jgi:hypothetical protein
MIEQEVLSIPDWYKKRSVAGSLWRIQLNKKYLQEYGLGSNILLINANTRELVEKAHKLGFKCITYVAFMDVYVTDGGDGTNWHQRVVYDNRKPGMLLLDKNGRPVNTFMDHTKRMNRFVVCNNTRDYVDAALSHAETSLKMGADGLFVDNCTSRLPCFGHNVRIGYSEKHKTVISADPRVTPVDPEVQKLSVHQHLWPEVDHNTAFKLLLKEVRRKVKSFGQDKVMVVNGTDFTDVADGGLWESFICSWGWNTRKFDWPRMKDQARQRKPYTDMGYRIVALSFLGHTPNPIKDDAYFCYAAARLLDFIWSDYQSMGKDPANRLYSLDLGEPTSEILTASGVDYRIYEKGIIALNPERQGKKVKFKVGPLSKRPALEDAHAEKQIKIDGHYLPVEFPAESGRVYVCD